MNLVEIWVCIIIMMIACMVFAYSMNTIGEVLKSILGFSAQISDNLYVINSYMKNKKINTNIQFQVREYLYYYWKHNQQNQQEQAMSLIQHLPDGLQQSLLREANSIVFRNNEIFNQFSDELKEKVVPLIQELQCPPEFVFFEKDVLDDSSVYFIERGEVELYFDASNTLIDKKRHLKINRLKAGQSFGIEEFLTGQKRSFSAKSL